MRTIIAGSRPIDDYAFFNQCVWHYGQHRITSVLSGAARGVDTMAVRWAGERDIPCATYQADWEHFGKSAGPRRNAIMARVGEALLALWDGVSPGTHHMIVTARDLGLPVTVYQARQLNGVWSIMQVEVTPPKPKIKQLKAFDS